MKKKTAAVIQIAAIAVFLCCAVCIGLYYYASYASDRGFEELREEVAAVSPEEAAAVLPEASEEPRAENGMLAGYYELYQKNSDMVGWIKIDGTKIDYPVVKGADNEFYLHKNFDKEYQYCGIPFADYQCDVEKPDDNIVIYAHNMKDGSMFAALLKYADTDFLNEHKTIIFDTLYERGEYELAYVLRTKPDKKEYINYCEFINAGGAEEFDEFIARAGKAALYADTENTPVYGDKLLTLSTCSYNTSNERLVVIAKKKRFP